jgi:hypothetical protein
MLWLAQQQPQQYYYIYPLFNISGLNIYSIGPLLSLPPDIILNISDKIDIQERARPDLILKVQKDNKFCILECKASSFGSASSNATQAKTLLLMAGNIISEVLGIGKRGENKCMLCYLVGSEQPELMEETIESLKKEINEKVSLDLGSFGYFGIKSAGLSILLYYSEKAKDFLHIIENSPVEVIKFEEETDPHPLYFIPYDPNNPQQTPEEQELCRRILFERIWSEIISKVGGGVTPCKVQFSTKELLMSATFGIYDIWEDNDAKRNIKKIVKSFLLDIKDGLLENILIYEPQTGWMFDLGDKKVQEEVLKQLQKFKPQSLDLSKVSESTLFDE